MHFCKTRCCTPTRNTEKAHATPQHLLEPPLPDGSAPLPRAVGGRPCSNAPSTAAPCSHAPPPATPLLPRAAARRPPAPTCRRPPPPCFHAPPPPATCPSLPTRCRRRQPAPPYHALPPLSQPSPSAPSPRQPPLPPLSRAFWPVLLTAPRAAVPCPSPARRLTEDLRTTTPPPPWSAAEILGRGGPMGLGLAGHLPHAPSAPGATSTFLPTLRPTASLPPAWVRFCSGCVCANHLFPRFRCSMAGLHLAPAAPEEPHLSNLLPLYCKMVKNQMRKMEQGRELIE
nr:formin-like protein 5 [Aegilops tauschii subsp. strangulata]